MLAPQTKVLKSKPSSYFFQWGGMAMFSLVVLLFWVFSFDTSATAQSDKVTVDGVANTTQYLTSMVLYTPWSNETVVLKYDPDLNALRIKGAINADALVIGDAESTAGNAVFWGEKNRIEWGADNGVLIGGKANTIKNASSNSLVIGGEGNSLLNTNNVAVVASKNTTFPTADGSVKQNVFVGGGDRNAIKGSTLFVFGAGGNEAGSESVLLGKNIKAWTVSRVFVRSPNDQSFSPQQSGAFYVNSKNGIWLNTNDPQVKFDFGNAGSLKLASSQLNTNAQGHCNAAWKGVMAYVSTGGVTGLCGCNGQEWVPLTADPRSHRVCVNLQKASCVGSYPNAIPQAGTVNPALPRRNLEANAGEGGWQPVTRTYGGVEPLTWTQRECGYLCNIGFHPGMDNPIGIQIGGCQACSDIANKSRWWSAGTGNNNCDFWCKGGYRYKNAGERSCLPCSYDNNYTTHFLAIAGKTGYSHAWYSPEDNQLAMCNVCSGKPLNAYYTLLNGATASCPWECFDGYNKRWNSCLKATWTKTTTRICRTTGRWKDAYDKYTYVCQDSQGRVSDIRICNVRWSKPNDYTQNVSDATCNAPEWTEWSCASPNCAWKCYRDTVQVSCSRQWRDPSGVVHNSETKTESRQCSGACDDGLCGAAAGVPTKTAPTTNLCIDSTAGAVQGTGPWTWICQGLHGSVSCSAPKDDSVHGQCQNYIVDIEWWVATSGRCKAGSPDQFTTGSNGWTRICRGQNGGWSAMGCSATCGGGLVFDSWTRTCKTPLQPVNGACQPVIVETAGNAVPHGLCAAWSVKQGSFGLTSNGWKWVCEWLNGGADSPQCSGSCKSPLVFRANGGSGICLSSTKTTACLGEEPQASRYIKGSSTYTQTLGAGTEYSPISKSWVYTDYPTLVWGHHGGGATIGDCEYTCKSWLAHRYNGTSWVCMPKTMTSNCWGTKPIGEGYIFGPWQYTQTLSAGITYTPSSKTWSYTTNTTPGACEYACKSGYTLHNGACARYKRKLHKQECSSLGGNYGPGSSSSHFACFDGESLIPDHFCPQPKPAPINVGRCCNENPLCGKPWPGGALAPCYCALGWKCEMSPEAKRAYGNDYYDPLCAYQGKMDETTCKSLNLYFKIPKPGDPPLNGYDIYGPENCGDIPPWWPSYQECLSSWRKLCWWSL